MVNRPLATSCEILVASAKFLVALATRKAQFQTPKLIIIGMETMLETSPPQAIITWFLISASCQLKN